MIKYYTKRKVLEKDGIEYPLTFLERNFIKCFKNSNFCDYETMLKKIYGNKSKIFLNSLKEVKKRLIRKTGIEMQVRYKTGYLLIDHIEFVEE